MSYKNGNVELLLHHLFFLLNPWVIVKIEPADIFPIGITLLGFYAHGSTGSTSLLSWENIEFSLLS